MEFENKQQVTGHVLIKDLETQEILVDKFNSINYEAFSVCLARAISNRPDSWIQEMCFGNGAASVSSTGAITYLPPNTVGLSAQLYNQTYYKVVNDQSPLNSNPNDNFMAISHSTGSTFTDVVITCTLELGEPAGQEAFDTTTNIQGTYVFNELGLKAYSSLGPNTGLLVSMCCFSPIQKSLNRQIQIVYTIRIQTV